MKKDSLSKSKKKNRTDGNNDEFYEETPLFSIDMFLPEPMCPTDDDDTKPNNSNE